MKLNHIYQGHALDVLRTFPDECVDTIITSCPYWGLRDYGDETRVKWSDAWYGQLGLEPTLELYLRHLLQITQELKRVLKKTGVLFWNHGDSYGGSGGSGGDYNAGGLREGQTKVGKSGAGIQPKCLALQNYRLILRMIDDQGWILRNDIKWVKPNHMPSSVKDRFANGYEPVFMLVKNKKYWFDLDAVREPHKLASLERLQRGISDHHKYSAGAPGQTLHSGINRPRLNKRKWSRVPGQDKQNIEKHSGYFRDNKCLVDFEKGKNPGDVWEIATQPFSAAHFATFPEKLVAPMIKCACPEWICKKCGKARVRITKKTKRDEPYTYQKVGIPGESNQRGKRERCGQYQAETIGWTDCKCSAGWKQGICLDPFMGSGTVAKVTRLIHRRYVAIEISKKYIKIKDRRLAQGIFDF